MHRAALLLLVACGHPPGGGVPTPLVNPPSGPPKLPIGPPLVTPGEHMQYKVSLQGVDIATYTFDVGEIQALSGKRVIVVQGHAKAIGLAAMLGGNVDDHFTSWLDVETGRSLRFAVDEYGTRTTDIEHTIVDLAGRKDDTIPVAFHVNNQPEQPEPQKVLVPEVWDYNAFLVVMRAWEAPKGTTLPMAVFRSRNLWHLDVKIHGTEKLLTELGEYPALRIDAHLYKLDRASGKDKGSDERDFSLWISNEGGRAPLRIDALTDYGSVKMEIVDYQPGNGEPLRK